MSRTSRLFVVSGPSGAGKGTLLDIVRKQHLGLGLTVSATTRTPRPGEIDGVNYYFLDDSDFEQKVEAGQFLEWAHVHGHSYGTLKSEVDDKLSQGQSLILELDVQGAFNVRKQYPDAVLIFIEPPSLQVLKERLEARGTEDEASLELRLKNAQTELDAADRYDVRIVNDKLDIAAKEMLATIESYEMN